MVRFGRRRGFGGRRRFRRRVNPRRLLAKARRLRRIGTRKIQRKKNRRQRKVKKNVWGYMDKFHSDAGFNETKIVDIGSSTSLSGLGARADMDEVFQQVRQFLDITYPEQTGLGTGQKTANRNDLAVNIRARSNIILTHNSNSGVIFGQVYVCKPRQNIAGRGIGVGSLVTPGSIITNNMNSKYLPDYNDAAGWSIDQAGTGGVLNIQQNANDQAKPVVAATDHWTTPFMIPEFTRHFKVLKVHKFALPPNGNFMFSLSLPLARIKRNEFQLSGNDTTGSVFWLRRWSRQIFIRFHGEPSSDNTTDSTVNYCSASLNGVIDKKYEFSYGHQPSLGFVTQFPTTLGTVAATTKNAEGTANEGEL